MKYQLSSEVREIVSFYLPQLLTAGRYARHIQEKIHARPSKEGDNAFQQALTDADLSVQAFLEVATLSRFPGVAFFGEEYADSLNAKYFPKAAGIEILVDPIDGTRAYLDGAEPYQIIVSIREQRQIVAALCHAPRRERCYVALRGEGAVVCSPGEMEQASIKAPRIALSDSSRRILLFNAPEVKRLLEPEFPVIDIFEEYRRHGVHHGFVEMLAGTAAACIHPRPQLIDAAAIAFIAEQAGGVLSDFAGNTLPFDHAPDQRSPGLVVSASAELHRKILDRLKPLQSQS